MDTRKRKKRAEELWKASKRIISDCALENGAIVAANMQKPYCSRTANNYHFVWPRDAGYIVVAADKLGLKISESYFTWLTERPEDFKKEGLLYQNYAPNGRMNGTQFQPDQMGTSLWAIHHHYQHHPSLASKYEVLIRRLADGICDAWRGKYFFWNTTDLWEEAHRMTSTKMENNFTYSLAACAKGLELANDLISNSNWVKVAKQMREIINNAYDKEKKYFLRNSGLIKDYNVDASLLGLVFPFEIIEAKDPRMVNTVKKMEERIVFDGGVHRYEFDYYDGEGTAQEGAGAWPLLNFWMSIYFSLAGNKKKALQYYDWVLERVRNGFIPEQIFGDFREGKGVRPLAWSHAMFVFATQKLGLIFKQ